jgi:hypothetical protein
LRIADFTWALKIPSAKTDGNLFVKRAAVFYWLIGIVIAAIAIAASFYFDNSVSDFMTQHQTRAVRSFMRYVSLFGDWPGHTTLGLMLLAIAWVRGSKKWTRVFLSMLIAMSIAGVAGYMIKRAIPRPRPSVHTEIRCMRCSVGNFLRHSGRACAAAGGTSSIKHRTSNVDVAEGVRFELTRPFGLPVFKTGAINRSATPPIKY